MWIYQFFEYLIRLIKNLKQCRRTFQITNTIFLEFTQIKWSFLVSIINFSFIKKVSYQNKTAACLAGNSFETFHTHIFFRPEQYWEFQNWISREKLFRLWSFITDGRKCFVWKNLSKLLIFVQESDEKTLPRPLPIYMALHCKHFVLNRMRTCPKTEAIMKSWNRFRGKF